MKRILSAVIIIGLNSGAYGAGSGVETQFSYSFNDLAVNASDLKNSADTQALIIPPDISESFPTPEKNNQLPVKYDYLDTEHQVPSNLLVTALAYYDANLRRIGNTRYLSVVDFSKHSSKKRLFIIDMKTGSVKVIHVAHGEGSDPGNTGYATLLSNEPGSNKSSLGFYKIGEIYSGAYGRSMRMDGLSSTNSNARSRNIVFHSFAFAVGLDVPLWTSWGCLVVSQSMIDELIAKLHGGSIVYAGLSGND